MKPWRVQAITCSLPHGKRMVLIAHPTWLQEAARKVLASRGSKTADLDGVTKTTLLPELDRCLDGLRDELLAGTYEPAPAKRIYMQKANGKP